jgi:NADH:ubiquinone oxidoreductase subunit 3 (subunit A)
LVFVPSSACKRLDRQEKKKEKTMNKRFSNKNQMFFILQFYGIAIFFVIFNLNDNHRFVT